MELNRTHDAAAASWLGSANVDGTDFPIQNLPFAVARRRGTGETFRGCVGIGDSVIDLPRLAESRLLEGIALEAARACAAPTLDRYLALGPGTWTALRGALFDLLREGSEAASESQVWKTCLFRMSDAEFAVPTSVPDYTDFYTSLHHAVNIGKLFGIDKPAPNFYTMPVAYHGRSSTVGISGQEVPRPRGQVRPSPDEAAVYASCRKLDYELELGVYVGVGNSRGTRIPVDVAEGHIFGVCILNDWSARDLQAYEMQPLGPFNAKNFATTVSPWIVTLEALAPFRAPLVRDAADGPLLPYLDGDSVRKTGALDIQLEVWLETARDRSMGRKPTRLSSTSFRHQYWTIAQMLAHHTDGGCGMRPGDLFGSGTVSGPSAREAGAMMELTRGGANPVTVGDGEARDFLADGDAVVMRGWCSKEGFKRIGLGECRGMVVAAIAE
jgi:fumarylacetoacetase